MPRRPPQDKNNESLMEVILMFSIAFMVLFFLIWFLASAKIVYWTSGILKGIGSIWFLIDPQKWAQIQEAYDVYRRFPHEIGFANYFMFASSNWQPWAFMLAAWLIGVAVWRIAAPMFGKATSLKRTLAPMVLAREISRTFPAIIPVLHLGPDLTADKLPLWRRQTFPEDVWQQAKVDGQPLVKEERTQDEAGATVKRQVLDRGLVERFFRGDTKNDKPIVRNGRRWSSMLGYLAVDVTQDAKRSNDICFADRFSSTGKVIYALLTAYAFGGRDGKKDYEKAAAQLNQSCAGQKNGLPNLTVAQWLYDKYRNQEQARQLFAIHHWEYTYLFGLFKLAKRNGKITHTNFIWLKPQDRILFYALNTVGRATPHTEAASAFAQYDFEVQCAKLKRFPLTQSESGKFEPSIAVGPAVEGLQMEYKRYLEAQDDNEHWWKEAAGSIWEAAHSLIAQEKGVQAKLRQAGQPQQTAYDTALESERRQRSASDLASTLASSEQGMNSSLDIYP